MSDFKIGTTTDDGKIRVAFNWLPCGVHKVELLVGEGGYFVREAGELDRYYFSLTNAVDDFYKTSEGNK